MHMQEIQLRKLDLNLLVALDALLSVEEVGLAAERMGISPSAMSHTLRRLREQFDDQLLIKGKGRMIKTPKAEALEAPLRKALLELERAIHSDTAFDPATSSHTFCLATNDYGDLILLPALLERLSRQAPNVNLKIIQLDPKVSLSPLEAGSVDLAVNHPLKDAAGIRQQSLFHDKFYCVTRQDHPLVKELDLDTYTALPHLQLSPRGEASGPVDRALQKLGRKRRIALQLLNFNSAPMIVARSDLILTAPKRCIDEWAKSVQLAVYPCPLPLPDFLVSMIWHERFQHHPAHRWLRQQLRDMTDRD